MGRLKSVDALRGAAALAVVLHHAMKFGLHAPLQIGWFRALDAVLGRGQLGVPMFFVISGFCIHFRWAKQNRIGGEQVDFVAFWKRRIYRLYPAYVVMLVISMSLVAVASWRHSSAVLVQLYPQPKPVWMSLDFLAHLTMLHGVIPLFDKAGGNPVYWTLAREEYLYLMYFVLLAWRRTRGVAVALGIVIAVSIVTVIVGHALVPTGDAAMTIELSAPAMWVMWTLGFVAAEAYCGAIRMPRWTSWWPMFAVWAALAELANVYCVPLRATMWGLTFFTLLNVAVNREQQGRWTDGVFVRWLERVGVFSYSLYLVHYPAQAIFKQLIGPVARTANPFVYLAVVAAMAVASYWAARLFFALVEKRFLAPKAPSAEPVPALQPA